MNRAAARVEFAAGGFGADDWIGLAGIHAGTSARISANVMVAAPHRPAALVVVVMAAENEIDPIAIEERQPGLTNPPVGPVTAPRRAECVLMHLHNDPLDPVVL